MSGSSIPLARPLEVLECSDGRWIIAATHAGRDVVRPRPFETLALDLAVLWDEPGSAP